MKKQRVTKYFSMMLAIVLLFNTIAVDVLAATIDYVDSKTDTYYKLISKKDYELAPGVLESEIVLNNDAGTHRQVAHVVEVDMSNPYTKVIPSYKGMKAGLDAKDYSVQVMSQQAAYAEANGYGNVVAAMNISLNWYTDDYYLEHPELVGEPLGYMILDGVQYTNSQGPTGGAQTCVVINYDEKDGVTRPADMPKVVLRSTADPITGWEEQVIPANFGFLVKDGKNQYSKNHTSDPATRSFVGIKADGTFVMVMNDGRQAPYSTGFNSYEMAEFMLSLGCVQAINGDGGGSSTFLSQRPGEELKLNCSPSDGAERETTHGILVISTAAATGEFTRASISSEYDYYTPNSTVEFSAIGSDDVGTAADIPADAVWKLADDTFGTIENGTFISNGQVGDVTVQIEYQGKIVGEDSIHIVMPDKIAFEQENMTVPYGKTVEIGIQASYNSKTVCIKEEDVVFELDNPTIGEIKGFEFTAVEEEIKDNSSKLTATIGEKSIETTITLGKGSKIVCDFEELEQRDLSKWGISSWYPQYGPLGSKKDENGNYYYNGQNELGYLDIVTAANGKVKNGKYALAARSDFSQTYETGYLGVKFMFPESIQWEETEAPIALGFWMYIPYEARHAEIRLIAGGTAYTVYDNGQLFDLVEGWNYIKLDITKLGVNTFDGFNIQVDDRACASTGSYYNYITEPNLNGAYTFYVDDITLDYSTAVDDREAPILGKPYVYVNENGSELKGQTVAANTLRFGVSAKENTALSNASGLNASSAKAYIDGQSVSCAYSNGNISTADVVLADGVHTVTFEMSDKAGNTKTISGKVNVEANSDASTIKIVPQDPTADRLKIGSLYWMDVVATDIETIKQVEMVLDLNNVSSWELDGLALAAGFSAVWNVDPVEQIATITITRDGENNSTGEAVLASFPVRTWESTITKCVGYEDQTPAKLVSRGIIWAQSIELRLKKGIITYVDSYSNATTGTFGMQDVLVDTELFFTNYTRANVEGAQAWINACTANGVGFHVHTNVTEPQSKAATCSEAGYENRTFCEECNSAVNLGTTLQPTGHSYNVVGNKLVCECEAVQNISGLIENNNKYYYFVAGTAQGGWQMIDDSWYYFDPSDYASVATYNNGYVTFEFEENGKLKSGEWYHSSKGSRYYYGPDYYAGNNYGDKRVTIDGNDYVFTKYGFCRTGYDFERIPYSTNYVWYDFGTDGAIKCQWDKTGLVTKNGYTYSLKKGVSIYGMSYVDGAYYYSASANHSAVIKNIERYCPVPNGLLPEGTYCFGVDGKMIDHVVYNENNVLYYYILGKKSKGSGTIELNGQTWSVESDGKVLFTGTIEDASGQTLDYVDGVHTHIPKNGPCGDYFYIDDVIQKAWKLVEWEGDYYFINDYDKLVKNDRLYLSQVFVDGHNYPNGNPMEPGYYDFDEDGKMILVNGVVDGKYYINGIAQTGWMLFEWEGNFYFNEYYNVAANKTVYLNQVFVDGHNYPNGDTMEPGYYNFDKDGKMILH